MVRHLFAAAFAASLLGAAPMALAGSCPMDMAAIDKAMSGAKLNDSEKAEVTKLRAEGEALHKSGQHPQSMAKLAEAKKILKIQ